MDKDQVDEIKRHFDVVAEQFRSDLKVAVEGLDAKIGAMDAKVDRLEKKMDEGFAEVKAMIKFSYTELDRRISVLESTLASLEARISKLEAN